MSGGVERHFLCIGLRLLALQRACMLVPFLLLLWLVESTEIGYFRIREGFSFLNMMHRKRDNAWLDAVRHEMRMPGSGGTCTYD